MKIFQLEVQNFKSFAEQSFRLNPVFNLIIGSNGSGKTSALDALAVAAGSWFLGVRGYDSRHIWPNEIRLAANTFDKEIRFEHQFPVRVTAHGSVLDRKFHWSRSLNSPKGRTKYGEASELKAFALGVDTAVRNGEEVDLPIISYYGTGRLWLEPKGQFRVEDPEKLAKKKRMSRLEGYRNSIDPRLSVRDLTDWIARQSWIGYQQGSESPVFRAVKNAIVGCVEDATNLYFDPERGEVIVVMKRHGAQPFANLSDGQRCMLAMVGDIAQKAARLNPQFGINVLKRSSGIVLIDELDLHLHPTWQRRVIHDLKRTFPRIQFVATSHSPQIIGEALPEEVIQLDSGPDSVRISSSRNANSSTATHPGSSFGMDSNWILKHVMGAAARNPEIEEDLAQLASLINKDRFEEARTLLDLVRERIGPSPELTKAETQIDTYIRLRDENDSKRT